MGATNVRFRLGYGELGTGHPAMDMSSMSGMKMSGMKMSGGSSSAGAYLKEMPHGEVVMQQRGNQLTGSITVSGLPPGSHHAVILRGQGRCARPAKDPKTAAQFPDLVANARGSAQVNFSVTVKRPVVQYGYYLTVLRDPTLAEVDEIGVAATSGSAAPSLAKDPTVLCGNV